MRINIMNFSRRTAITLSFVAACLQGCASSSIDWEHSKVLSALPANIQGSTVAVYPLDKEKVGKIETIAIQNHITAELNKMGVKSVSPRQEIPTYFILFDYANELGIAANYEQVFLLIAYSSTNPPQQVYKAKLSIDSKNNNTVENVNNAITNLFNRSAK